MRRRQLMALSGLLATPLPGRRAQAQAFPARTIRLIVPYAPGGTTDVLARLYATRMTESLGQTVVVENRGGGGTLVGIRAAAAAPADGYSLLVTTSALSLNPLTDGNAGYRLEDFAAVGLAGQFPYVLMVPASLPVRSIAELVAYGRAHRGALNFSSLGRATPTSLLTTRFLAAAGIEAVEVSYTSVATAANDVIAGRVQMHFTGAQAGNLAADRMRPLAVTATERLQVAPQVPTFAESGFPTMVGGTWFGIFAPAATPAPILARLVAATAEAGEALRPRLDEFGVLPAPSGAEAIARFVREDQALWMDDLRRSGLLVR